MLKEIKLGSAPGWKIWIEVMVELCRAVPVGLGMLAECVLCIVVPCFQGKGDIINCSCYRAV